MQLLSKMVGLPKATKMIPDKSLKNAKSRRWKEAYEELKGMYMKRISFPQ